MRQLFDNGTFQSPWLLTIRNTLVECGLDSVWQTHRFTSPKNLCKNVEICLKEIYVRSWRNALENSNKALLYRNFKTKFEQEKYIHQLPDTYIIAIARFRCSNHKLPIEQGRKRRIPREMRLCSDCDSGSFGDEFHFLLECAKYSDLRKQYIAVQYRSVKSVYNVCRLLSSCKGQKLRLAKFLKACKIV